MPQVWATEVAWSRRAAELASPPAFGAGLTKPSRVPTATGPTQDLLNAVSAAGTSGLEKLLATLDAEDMAARRLTIEKSTTAPAVPSSMPAVQGGGGTAGVGAGRSAPGVQLDAASPGGTVAPRLGGAPRVPRQRRPVVGLLGHDSPSDPGVLESEAGPGLGRAKTTDGGFLLPPPPASEQGVEGMGQGQEQGQRQGQAQKQGEPGEVVEEEAAQQGGAGKHARASAWSMEDQVSSMPLGPVKLRGFREEVQLVNVFLEAPQQQAGPGLQAYAPQPLPASAPPPSLSGGPPSAWGRTGGRLGRPASGGCTAPGCRVSGLGPAHGGLTWWEGHRGPEGRTGDHRLLTMRLLSCLAASNTGALTLSFVSDPLAERISWAG